MVASLITLIDGFPKPVIWYISGHAAILCSHHSWIRNSYSQINVFKATSEHNCINIFQALNKVYTYFILMIVLFYCGKVITINE